MKTAKLDHLFVPEDEVRSYMRGTLKRVEERAYELFEARGRVHGHDWEDWAQAASEVFQPVTAEASETGDSFVAIAAVAGYRPEDLRASAAPRRLTICGRSNENDANRSSSEGRPWRCGCFYINFSLPAEIDVTAATAEIRRDILELRLPKVHRRREAVRESRSAITV